jgi:hypothetical protein
MKKKSGDTAKLAERAAALLSGDSGGRKDDENYWKPTADKSGNGSFVIRFLPGSPADGGDEGPMWVKKFSHGFQGPTGQWLIEDCPTTLGVGTPCPICEHNKELWATGVEANKEIVRKQKRKTTYISNIYIVSDSKNPENEGKVKLFKYGTEIFEKLMNAMSPQFEDEQAFDPFDLWAGANFKLKFRVSNGQRTYDRSEFDVIGPLLDDDEALEKVWKSEFSLNELVSEKVFKTNEELVKELNRALNIGGKKPTTAEKLAAAPKRQVDEQEEPPFEPSVPAGDDDSEDYFKSLAED